MQLNQLQPKHELRRKRVRVGRGGKRGTSSGKGTKGQKSRSGRRIRPAVRDLIQRLPKLRGYANKPLKAPAVVLTLPMLEKMTSPVSIKSLTEAHVIKAGQTVKVLANGEIKKAVMIEGIKVSASAKAAIEKAGGKVS